MPENPRLALLEASHQANRALAALAKAQRGYHDATLTAVRSIAKQLRLVIKTLNSPPLLQDRTDAPMVHEPTTGSQKPVLAHPSHAGV